MTKQELKDYVDCGREIEFNYRAKRYSITYYDPKKEKDYISFCEFHQEPIDVCSVEALAGIPLDGKTLMQVLESLTMNDIWIF